MKRRPSLEQFPPTSTERQLSIGSLWFKSHVWRQLAKNESRDVEEQVLTSPTMRLCYWRPLAVFEFHSIRYIGYINEDPVHYIRIECWACWPKINLINRNLFVPGIRKDIVQETSFFTYDEIYRELTRQRTLSKKLKRSEMNAFIETDERLHAAKDN